ncbi:hypothetical protein BSL78_05624 [Apostichopus japonicus]|uniref:Uncharacterized protein n=1 Tax=Stichopus japonicus TaxID=307972 RepID=A0A2G8JVX0_STIJA|nr:hypothetical protein BSL78_23280 [Apostichopus japonicus]PIK57471.1 hypothetical protein BSL78_05624 [Apostichopus japonicus]
MPTCGGAPHRKCRKRAYRPFSPLLTNTPSSATVFDNITHFRETYGVQASWNFFATSHGKGVVHGIGGQVKRLVWTAMRNGAHVHDAESFAEVAAAKAKAIKVIFVPSQKVEDAKEALDNRWADVCQSTSNNPYYPHCHRSQETLHNQSSSGTLCWLSIWEQRKPRQICLCCPSSRRTCG